MRYFNRLSALVVILALFSAACSNPDTDKRRHFAKGQRLAEAHQYGEAILEYRSALKIDPVYGDARYALAEALSQRPQTPDVVVETMRQYTAAAELLPNNFDAQLRAATLLLAAGDFERARKHATAAIKLNPKSVPAQTILAMGTAGMKDVDTALNQIQEAVRTAPSDFRPYMGLGTIQSGAGHTAEAEAAFRQAVALAPDSVPANTALGYFYWSINRPELAEKAFRAASAPVPYDATANKYLALFLVAHGRASEAETPLLRLANQKDEDAILMLADLYLTEKQPARARPLLASLTGSRIQGAAAVGRLASLDYQDGKVQQAKQAVDQVLKAQPNNLQLLTLKTNWAVVEHRPDDALEFATRAVKADSNSAPAQYWLGMAYMSRRQQAEAVNAFQETLRLNPHFADAQVRLSRLMLAGGKADEALTYAEAARKERATVDTQASVVSALLAKNELNRAETELAVLVQQKPDLAITHTLRGQLLSARADLAGASREFDRALEIDPTSIEALAGRLSVDAKQKRFAEGRSRLATSIAAKPDNSALLVLGARFENTAGDAAAAERYLRKSIEVDPLNLTAYSMLGQMYFTQHRLDEAKAEFQRMAAQRPDNVAALTMVGTILTIQGRADEAIKVYENVVKGAPRAGVAANNLAYYYATRNTQLQMALQLAQTAKQMMPDSPDVDDTLGFVYYKLGFDDRAIEALEHCAQKDPRNPGYQYHLGLAYARKGVTDKARASLQKALDLQPNFDGANDARAVLGALGK